jgi:hypothetical protein
MPVAGNLNSARSSSGNSTTAVATRFHNIS